MKQDGRARLASYIIDTQALDYWMTRNNISPIRLAKLSGVPKATVSKILNAKRPRLTECSMIMDLARALGIPWRFLISFPDDSWFVNEVNTNLEDLDLSRAVTYSASFNSESGLGSISIARSIPGSELEGIRLRSTDFLKVWHWPSFSESPFAKLPSRFPEFEQITVMPNLILIFIWRQIVVCNYHIGLIEEYYSVIRSLLKDKS